MNVHGFILPARIIGCILLLLALVPAALGVWFFALTRSFLATSKTTQGTVTAIEKSADSNGSESYYVVFEFSDESGATQRVISRWASNPPSHAAGSSVEVLYAPDEPSNARIRGFLSLWFGPTLCAILVVPPLVSGLVFVWLIPLAIRRVWKA